MKKVLITGASGFVGSRLCEVLALTGAYEPVAFIHSTASAARIARLPMNFVLGDLCDADSVRKAAAGCTMAVHLARGGQRVMRQGLENLLNAACDQRMERVVHVSSVAVYGDHPTPECTSEVTLPSRVDNAYGQEKLLQERLVMRFVQKKSLPAVILRPPNIYGPFSYYTLGLFDRVKKGSLPVVDDGASPCNIVYIDNLVEAILLSLWKPEAVGEAFFVVDAEPLSWADYLGSIAKLLGVPLPKVSSAALREPTRERLIVDSLRQVPRVMMSGELRSVLRQIPLAREIEKRIYDRFESLSADRRQDLRFYVNGSECLGNHQAPHFNAGDNLISVQRRSVAHSSTKAKRRLGYQAMISHQEGMALTEQWLRFCHIL